MFKKLTVIILLTLLLACSSEEYERLKISATTWIGYSPIYYAKEKGWLKPLNIKILHVASLSENMYLYQAGNADAYVGTQYEYGLLVQKDPTLLPIMMLDRSNGGDIIMSNSSIEELQNTGKSIDVYLEMDSINKIVLIDFIKKYKLENKKLNYNNQDQAQNANLTAEGVKNSIIVVTYIPYDVELAKYGFKKIASTKDGLELLVVDALFTTNKTLHDHKAQFIEFKKRIDDAIIVLNNDPREFYETIKYYIFEISFDEFMKSLNDIIWINKEMSSELKKRLEAANFPTRDLL